MSFILSSKVWAKLLYYQEKIDNKVNAHKIADYYDFANMKDDYVHIFEQLAHPLKCYADCMCEVGTFYLQYPTVKVLVLASTSGNVS